MIEIANKYFLFYYVYNTFQIFPLFYILTTKKSAFQYRAIFKYIENVYSLQPKEIITDFETGLRKAINQTYSTVTLRGCWFHYSSAILKKCNSLGMRRLLSSNAEARFYKKQISSIPLLPSIDILPAYKCLKSSIESSALSEDFKLFLKYFESYWLVQVINAHYVIDSSCSMLTFII